MSNSLPPLTLHLVSFVGFLSLSLCFLQFQLFTTASNRYNSPRANAIEDRRLLYVSDHPYFAHGVASFDPTSSSVILWTRVTDNTITGSQSLMVSWTLATDPNFGSGSLVNSGTKSTSADLDYTAQVDVTGLNPYTFYYYKFTYCSTSTSSCFDSVAGRTKTAPSFNMTRSRESDSEATENGNHNNKNSASDDDDDDDDENDNIFPQLRFATVSCSNYQHGWFHAYDQIYLRDDVDAVLHLGDYIYDNAVGDYGDIRDHNPPNAAVSLSDYRGRFSQYRMEQSLQRLHQHFPFITTWDDHEFANNAWWDGALEHDEETQGSWVDRRNAAAQAYREWLPFRRTTSAEIQEALYGANANDDATGIRRKLDRRNDELPYSYDLYRRLSYGNLVDLFVLDNRIVGRDEQRGIFSGGQAMFLPSWYDTDHDLLGSEQMHWLKHGLSNSKARWKVLVQPIVLSPISVCGLFSWSSDAWDGYQADRAEVLGHIADNHIDNVVILSGDVHSTLIGEINQERTANLKTWGDWLLQYPWTYWIKPRKYVSIAVEFVTTSVSSATTVEDDFGPCIAGLANFAFRTVGLWINAGAKYANTVRRGYQIVDFQPVRAQADIFFTGDPAHEIDELPDKKRYQRSYFTKNGQNELKKETTPSKPLDGGAAYTKW